ncbi:MAG: hypothetical protein ACPGLY_27160 [Rubripirellula sp.]
MGRVLKNLRCKECGKFFINLTDYASCPDGHGRLVRKLTLRERALTESAEIPAVTSGPKYSGVHHLDGKLVRFTHRFGMQRAAREWRHGAPVARCDQFIAGWGLYEYVD